MCKNTLGPWKAVCCFDGLWVVSDGKDLLLEVGSKSNANLIAIAPDMLVELKFIRDLANVEHISPAMRDAFGRIDKILDKLK